MRTMLSIDGARRDATGALAYSTVAQPGLAMGLVGSPPVHTLGTAAGVPVQLRAVLQGLVEIAIEKLQHAVESRTPTRQDKGGLPLTLTEAARRLRLSLHRTLAPAIAAGHVQTIPWGNERRVTLPEVERLLREGFGGRPRRGRRRATGPRPDHLAFDQGIARARQLTFDKSRSGTSSS